MHFAMPPHYRLIAGSPFLQQARRDPQFFFDLPSTFPSPLPQLQGFPLETLRIRPVFSLTHPFAPDLVYFATFFVSTISGQVQGGGIGEERGKKERGKRKVGRWLIGNW